MHLSFNLYIFNNCKEEAFAEPFNSQKLSI